MENDIYLIVCLLLLAGVIMYECLFGKAPYSSSTLKELIDKIQNRTPIVVSQPLSIIPAVGNHPQDSLPTG